MISKGISRLRHVPKSIVYSQLTSVPGDAMEVQLDFTNQAFVELLSEDGLLILARFVNKNLFSYEMYLYLHCRGLGLDGLFLNFLKLYSDPHNLVIVLNTSATLEVRTSAKHILHVAVWGWGGGGVECLYLALFRED